MGKLLKILNKFVFLDYIDSPFKALKGEFFYPF